MTLREQFFWMDGDLENRNKSPPTPSAGVRGSLLKGENFLLLSRFLDFSGLVQQPVGNIFLENWWLCGLKVGV